MKPQIPGEKPPGFACGGLEVPLWQRRSLGHPALPKAASACPGLVNHCWPFRSSLPEFPGGFVFLLECQGMATCPVLSPAPGAAWESWHGHSPARGTALLLAVPRLSPWHSQHSLEPHPRHCLPSGAAEQSHSPLGAPPLRGATQGPAAAPQPSELTFPSCICPRRGHESPLPVPACRAQLQALLG